MSPQYTHTCTKTTTQFTRSFFVTLSVDRDSAIASRAGEIIAIIVVLQFPPSESSRMRVSFESR